jgi:hypothetical protein
MKSILKNSFYQLIGIYSIIILFISLGLFWKYSLQFHILAIVVALLGITITKVKLKEDKVKYFYYFFGIAILFILFTRIYTLQGIPLGYDAGIYKYAIENFKFFQTESWLKSSLTPGFFYLTFLLKQFFSSNTIITYIFIAFNVILGISIYFVTKEYFNKKAGIIALLLYSLSIIQFKVFTYLYYKNILGLITLLWSLYFLRKEKRISFIIFSVLTGILHRPTFFIFGLSYLGYSILNYKDIKKHIINGISILFFTSIFYIGYFKESILPLISPVAKSFIETGTASGTFINFFTYQYSVLAYLPLAILGFFYLIKRKDYNMFFFWSIITFAIVYFQFFFFNRFIIMLDIALIILAGAGFSILISKHKNLGISILIILLFSLAFVTINESLNTQPLISDKELETIQYLQNTEENAYVMSTLSLYSPYILGYSNRNTIAPGLFQYNQHKEQEWQEFWTTNDINQIKQFLDKYDKPLYIFIGEKQLNNLKQFDSCFEIYYEKEKNEIYKYTC